jgi:hypothetical protein
MMQQQKATALRTKIIKTAMMKPLPPMHTQRTDMKAQRVSNQGKPQKSIPLNKDPIQVLSETNCFFCMKKGGNTVTLLFITNCLLL